MIFSFVCGVALLRVEHLTRSQTRLMSSGTDLCIALQDLRRIKQEGPTLEDVTQALPFTLKREDGSRTETEYKWVPKDVITASGQYVTKEPEWAKLPQMSFMEFYQVSCT